MKSNKVVDFLLVFLGFALFDGLMQKFGLGIWQGVAIIISASFLLYGMQRVGKSFGKTPPEDKED